MTTALLVAGGAGLGDAMVLSAVAHELRRQRPADRVVISSAYPELFDHNPDVDEAIPWLGVEHRTFPELDDMRVTGGEHQVRFMCRRLGLEPPRVVRQRFTFAPGGGKFPAAPYVTVQVEPGPWAAGTKTWPRARWCELIEILLTKKLTPVLVGTSPAFGVTDVPPIRKTAEVLATAALHIGPISGPMHLANAVGTRSLVIAGGREEQAVVGYDGDVWLTHAPAEGCSPCWATRCALTDETPPCLDAVSVDAVVAAVETMLREAA